MSLVGGGLHIGDDLDPYEQSSGLSRRGDQVCPYVGPDVLIFWSIWKSIEVCHGDGYISAWFLEHLLVTDYVESIIKVVWDKMLLLVCSSLSTISVALFTLLSLFVGFTVNNWFNIADVENQISSSRWKDQKAGKTRGVRQEIQVVVFVLGV